MMRAAAVGLVGLMALSGCSDSGLTSSAVKVTAPDPNTIVVKGIPTMTDLYKGDFALPPQSSPGPVKGRKSVWWVTCDSAVPACLIPGEAAQEAGKELGIDVTIADGKFNIGGAQSAAIRSAIAAGADGIILYGMNCSNVQQALVEAEEAGVPVMGAATPDCSDAGGPSLFTAPMIYNESIKNSMDWYRQMGALSAQYIINRANGHPRIIYNFNRAEAQLRAADDGFRAEWAKCATCEMVDEIEYAITDHVPNGPWIQEFRSALIRYPDINGVFLDWDVEMSVLGGVQAIYEAGLTNAIVFGGEGVPETFDFVREGRVDALTKVTSREWFGYAAMDNMVRALHGMPAVPQGLGLVVTDAEHNLPAPGEIFAGPPGVDFKSLYRQIWQQASAG
jgi:ribose transport system substrate-binding protein